MANTTFSSKASDYGDYLQQKAWAKQLLVEAKTEIFFSRYWGSGPENMIQKMDDLENKAGDSITYPLLMALSGSGKTGDSQLEGNEEAMTYYADTVTIDQLRHAVRIKGRMTEKRVAMKLRNDAKRLLRRWMAEKIDYNMFVALAASPTKAYYGGDATSTSDIASDDLISVADISKCRVYCRAAASPKIPALRVQGRNTYIMLVHPFAVYDLKNNESVWAQATREAQLRGNTNPIFTDATGVWDGVIIAEHENIPKSTTWGSGDDVTGCTNLFLGASAGVIAFGKKMFWVEKDFDYANETGISIGVLYGENKSVFNSKDYGCIAYRCAVTSIS